MKSYEREIKSALRKAAERGFAYAKEECPVRTGKLRNSINLSCSDNAAEIGTSLSYAGAVELGTGRSAPNPFLGRAAVRIRKEAAEIFINEMFGGVR